MKYRNYILFGLLVIVTPALCAAPLQLLSPTAPSLAPAGGGGDSWMPVVSRDGRYVLFASSANNLAVNSSNGPYAPVFPPSQNIYLRDRTNGTTILVSVNQAGTGGGDGDSLPVDISTNGQYVLFESAAANLVPGTTNFGNNIFLRDLVHNTTQLVSVNTNGIGANGLSRSSVMSPDGRYVAFVSVANDLVAGDTNNIPDVFVRDMQAGVTTLVSVGAKGGVSSELPDITPDGRYVAFYSTATNLVAGVTTSGEIYVRDLVAGTTTQASIFSHTATKQVFNSTNCVSFKHSISDDGQYVAYEALLVNGNFQYTAGMILRYNMGSGSTDIINSNCPIIQVGSELTYHSLDMTPDGRFVTFVAKPGAAAGTTAIYLWDASSNSTTLVSGNLASNTVPANTLCDWPVMDSTGRYIAFISTALGLTSNTVNGAYHIYLRDMQAATTQLVDVDTNGAGSPATIFTTPRISTNGQVIAFEAANGALTANDNNQAYDVFVRDIANQDTELISAHHPSLPSLTSNGRSHLSTLCVNSNAHFIAFSSDANNFTANDSNAFSDIFVRNVINASNILVSVDTNGILPGNGLSIDPVVSADGRYVAFTSSATNLTVGDTNKHLDVFVRDLQLGTTRLVSITTNGSGSGNGDSYSPMISSDGRYVLVHSKAQNLAPGITSSTFENLYWRDLQSAITRVFTTNNLTDTPIIGAMTPDGRFVAVTESTKPLNIWDTQLNTRVYTNSIVSASIIGISPDGTRIGFVVTGSGGHVYAADRVANTNIILGTPHSQFNAGLRFSSDSRFMAYTVTDAQGTNQVNVYDFQSATNSLISHDAISPALGGSGNSDSPDISPDGRFVAFRSIATNLVAGISSPVPQIYLCDQTTGTITLVSTGTHGNFAADTRSLTPVFSADAQTLVFESWADDLAASDSNQGSDVFSLSLSANGQPGFAAGILFPAINGQLPTITWPVAPGKNYQVQFKNQLTDPVWQALGGTVTTNGNQGSLSDVAPAAGQRFYRIVSF